MLRQSSKSQLPREIISIRKENRHANNLQSNCPRIGGQAQNSNCLQQEFSIKKENIMCKPCVPDKTIQFQLIKIIWISSKFQVPCAKNFHHERKQPCVPNKKSAIQLFKNSWTRSKFQLPRARIFHHERK